MFWSYLIFSLKKENDNYVGHCLQFLRVWAKKLLNDIELRLYRLTVNESWWHVNTNAYKMPKKHIFGKFTNDRYYIFSKSISWWNNLGCLLFFKLFDSLSHIGYVHSDSKKTTFHLGLNFTTLSFAWNSFILWILCYSLRVCI